MNEDDRVMGDQILHTAPRRGPLRDVLPDADGLKFDSGKPRWDLLPVAATGPIVDVLTAGAKKYAANNWQKVAGGKRRYYRAAIGHLNAWWVSRGRERDPESGFSHLAHAACNVIFLLAMETMGRKFPPETDPKEPEDAEGWPLA